MPTVRAFECYCRLVLVGKVLRMLSSPGDGEKGEAECPFEFYQTWVTDPLEAQRMSERVTRPTIGISCCPVAGIPEPKEEEEDLVELTHELNLT